MHQWPLCLSSPHILYMVLFSPHHVSSSRPVWASIALNCFLYWVPRFSVLFLFPHLILCHFCRSFISSIPYSFLSYLLPSPLFTNFHRNRDKTETTWRCDPISSLCSFRNVSEFPAVLHTSPFPLTFFCPPILCMIFVLATVPFIQSSSISPLQIHALSCGLLLHRIQYSTFLLNLLLFFWDLWEKNGL